MERVVASGAARTNVDTLFEPEDSPNPYSIARSRAHRGDERSGARIRELVLSTGGSYMDDQESFAPGQNRPE